MIHYLHIGKTGGNSIKAALRPFVESHDLVLHKHATRLEDVPAEDQVFFFLRDPMTRFVSGFNSRLRKGFPRRTGRWSPGEERAFATFTTPNSLAEALDTPEGAAAAAAIQHVNRPLSYWLGDARYVMARAPLLIGEVETLPRDFARLTRLLGIDGAILPTDPVVTHETPPGFDQALSDRARANVKQYLADDIELWLALRSSKIGSHAG